MEWGRVIDSFHSCTLCHDLKFKFKIVISYFIWAEKNTSNKWKPCLNSAA